MKGWVVDMNDASEKSIRKRAREDLRGVIRSLKLVGDHGTVAKLQPILDRLIERGKE